LAISKSTIVFATFSDSYEQWSHSCPLILRIHIRASSQVPFYGFEALKKNQPPKFKCLEFWLSAVLVLQLQQLVQQFSIL